MSTLWKDVFVALAGLFPAMLAEYLALEMAGAGHGWVSPLFCGAILFLAWPATLAVLAIVRRRRRLACALLVGAGLVADAVLALSTLLEGTQYFERVLALGSTIPVLWILLWLGWQAAALLGLLVPVAAPGEAV
jgi:hypothetical protein